MKSGKIESFHVTTAGRVEESLYIISWLKSRAEASACGSFKYKNCMF